MRDVVLWLLLLLVVTGDVAATASQELWAAANSQWQQQRFDETLALLLQIKRVSPEDPMLPMALGAVYQSKNDFETALAMYQSAQPQLSQNADLHANIGQLFYQLKDMKSAIESYRHAITLDAAILPRTAHLLALAYHYNGELSLAEQYYEMVEKKTAECHFDFAVTLQRLGKIEQANREYNRALALNENLPQAWLNIAALHQQFGEVNASIPHYLKVLELAQTPPHLKLMAMTNLGVAYEVTENIVSALDWFNTALRYIYEITATTPTPPNQRQQQISGERLSSYLLVLVHMARSKKTACVWEQSEQDFDHLLQLVLEHETSKGKPSSFLPFDTLMHQLSPLIRKQIAMVHTNQFVHHSQSSSSAERLRMPTLLGPDSSGEDGELSTGQLRVGYISYDFTDHPTAYLLKGLFSTSDRERTKVIAFGYGKHDQSQIRQEIVEIVDIFEDIARSSIEQSVATIRSHRVHILMDAQVHTRGSRMAIIAARPAPIVVNYLVYPGTYGASFVDYLITDRHVLPAELAEGFTEKLVFLPHSYQVNAYDLDQNERAKLWETGLDAEDSAAGDLAGDEDVFVFVNFNKPDKVEPNVFAMWMSILRRVPKSVLLLLDPAKKKYGGASITSREIKNNIAREAEAQGIVRSRIRFLPRIPKVDHLKRHNVNGLFLDTFIYGAHSTATDALYAGLPFLTLAGDSHTRYIHAGTLRLEPVLLTVGLTCLMLKMLASHSRVGISLLSNIGMDELVTFSHKEYEDLAATHADCYAVLQRKLRDGALAHPLFQTPQYTQSLEASQRVMYDLHSAVEYPYHIAVGNLA